jgi:homoserine kinase
VLGYLTAVGCRNMTVAAAEREREAAEHAMRDRVAEVTRDLVLVPTGQEISQYERFRRELAVASAVLSRSPSAHQSGRSPRGQGMPNGR